MANSKAISIRVHDELLDKIDKLAEDKYKSRKGIPNRSQVVLDAIDAYFDTLSDTINNEDCDSVSDSVSIVEFNELQEKFNELQEKVISLSDTVDQIKEKMFSVSDNVSKVDEEPLEHNQLSIIPVSDSVEVLNGKELSKRLGVTQPWVSINKNNPKFPEWSKDRDPESTSWVYNSATKKFSPTTKPLD
jgi:metal-responsive CopG/Arc/MetJ family transcriptional regulator